MDDRTIQFNTGREYAEEGQVITARLVHKHDDIVCLVEFNDHTRAVYGTLLCTSFTPNAIMHAYDRCHYIGNWAAGNIPRLAQDTH